MWGRAWFYFFISLLCFVEIQTQFTITFLVGIYLFVVALLMLIISRQAASKYRRIFEARPSLTSNASLVHNNTHSSVFSQFIINSNQNKNNINNTQKSVENSNTNRINFGRFNNNMNQSTQQTTISTKNRFLIPIDNESLNKVQNNADAVNSANQKALNARPQTITIEQEISPVSSAIEVGKTSFDYRVLRAWEKMTKKSQIRHARSLMRQTFAKEMESKSFGPKSTYYLDFARKLSQEWKLANEWSNDNDDWEQIDSRKQTISNIWSFILQHWDQCVSK